MFHHRWLEVGVTSKARLNITDLFTSRIIFDLCFFHIFIELVNN